MERNNNYIRSSYNTTNLGGSSCSSGTTNIMRELNQQYHRYNHITNNTTTRATTNIHSKVINSTSSSWDISMLEKYEEEQYLNELSSWPPRSYTCSFCKREFRSAQALGGHMNVHRRDRARLRSVQSPTTTSPTTSTNTTALNLNLNNNPNPADIISNTDRIRTSFSSSLLPPLQTAAVAAAPPPRPPASPLVSTKQHDHQASPCCRKLPFLDVSSTHYCRPSNYYSQPLSTYRDIPVHQYQQQQQQRGTSNDSALLDGTLMSRKREQGYGSKIKSCPRSACLGIVGDKCDGALSKKQSLVRLDLEMGVLIDAKDDLDLELRLGFN